MTQWVHYGSDRIEFEIPEGSTCFTIDPQEPTQIPEPMHAIEQALRLPAGHSLESIVKPGTRVCIISDDISRPTPVALILKVLLPRLHQLGVQADDISLVMALGSHRSMTPLEINVKLGKDVADRYRVFQSAFKNPDDLVDLGLTDTGIPIEVYKIVMESDVRIGIGNIVPHGTLGWSGGAKILFPGVTSEKTVSQFHLKAALIGNSNFGDAENEIRHDIEKWAQMIGLHFIINTVLLGSGQIYRVVAGDPVKAHRAGVAYGKDIYCVQAPEKADIVVVDSHPSDGDFWQGTKGFYPSDIILKDQGTSVLVAPCFEGEGPHPEYAEMIGHHNTDDFLNRIIQGQLPNLDPLAVAVGAQLSRMRRRFHMSCYSNGLPDDVLAKAKISRVTDIQQELVRLNQIYGGKAKIAIIRCGAEVVPEIAL